MTSENKRNITCGAAALLSMFALRINLDLQEGENSLLLLLDSLKSVDITDLIFLPLLFGFYRYVQKLEKTEEEKPGCGPACMIPAFLFSFFMVMGYSFYKTNSWDLVLGSRFQFIKSTVAFLGWFFLFLFSIRWLFFRVDHLKTRHGEKAGSRGILRRYLDCLRKYPFRVSFLTLAVLYLPYMILSYPGILSTDSRRQIIEGYTYLHETGGHLKNHHPILHTLALSGLVSIGEGIFGSANAGVFLYSCAQAALMFAAVSWLVRLLAELELSDGFLTLPILYLILLPRNQNYMLLAVKDVWFAAFLMIYLTQLYRMATETFGRNPHRFRHTLLFLLSALGVFFMRQDGMYLLLLTSLAAVILNPKHRKWWVLFGVGMLGFSLLYQSVILPGLGISPSSRREMLSIPFQQTARYVRDAGDEVTDEERDAISAILDYENLGTLYNPNLSDPVKGTFDDDASSEELSEYFRVWFQMLLKRPDIYVQATMNNLYGYFYPNGYAANGYDYGKSAEQMEKLGEALGEEYGFSVSYPSSLDGAREGYENLRERIYLLPGLSALLNPACYVWSLLLWFSWCVRKREKTAILMTVPLMIFLLICMAGPAYGWYFRYLYSLAACLPAAIIPGMHHAIAEKRAK